MKRSTILRLLILLVLVLAGSALLTAGGCSLATVTEYYETTPTETRVLGPGVRESEHRVESSFPVKAEIVTEEGGQ